MRRTKEDALRTREALLDSAQALFLHRGYSAVTLADIAGNCSCTRGALYWHFKSKEDILRALVVREDQFLSGLLAELLAAEKRPEEKIRHVLTGIVRNFYRNLRFRNFIQLTSFSMEQSVSSPFLKFKTVAVHRVAALLAKLVRDGQKSGSIAAGISASTWAWHAAAVINGIYRLHFVAPRKFGRETVAQRIILQLVKELQS